MKEIKNVYSVVFTHNGYPDEEPRIHHILESNMIATIKKVLDPQGVYRIPEDWTMRSVNLIAEDVDY